MIVQKVMNISNEEFFEYIMENLHKELQRIVSKDLKVEDVKEGYTFTRHFKRGKQEFEVKSEIRVLDIPNSYMLVMETNGTEQIISHIIRKIDDDHIEDTYEEDIISNRFLVKLNKSMRSKATKKKMIQTLDLLEQEIMNRRNPETTEESDD